MDAPSGRFSQLRWLQSVVCVTAMIGAVVLMGLGIVGVGHPAGGVNAWMIIGGSQLLFAAVMVMTFIPIALKVESTLARQLSEMRDLNESIARQASLLQSIGENTRISDSAKSLAHRDQEMDALRVAIRSDLRNQNWEAGATLIDEMERRFGGKEETDRFREELDDVRNEAIEAKLNEAIEMIESHFQSFDWARAQSEIDRLLLALPDNAQVSSLQDRMKMRKEEHKTELLAAWDDAVRRSDTDLAIDILKELDQYLSPAEAKTIQASARDVFKEKLLQYGVQFRFAVNEKRWQDALSVGLELIREYPNARMANEVRDVLDTLRERARSLVEGSTEAAREPKAQSVDP